jgi:hypothetical protein
MKTKKSYGKKNSKMLTVLNRAGMLMPDYNFEFKVFASIPDFNNKQSPCFLSIFTISLELMAFSNAGDFGVLLLRRRYVV